VPSGGEYSMEEVRYTVDSDGAMGVNDGGGRGTLPPEFGAGDANTNCPPPDLVVC